ncbi:hypothetical protein SISNIDRAFT_487716 [Sistotremastrum niveocremeum HHB9708]|uniref:Uncharacterized protein n=1 Tax=Sistotremastrum niveocremeum HHB9708 TaxID=1314777 RepID=A0A164RZK1_9AGAM|nr:hypothetical protein SISNIDRAFT_487716 [Sistotremastrum niveocremeum HHB9708]
MTDWRAAAEGPSSPIEQSGSVSPPRSSSPSPLSTSNTFSTTSSEHEGDDGASATSFATATKRPRTDSVGLVQFTDHQARRLKLSTDDMNSVSRAIKWSLEEKQMFIIANTVSLQSQLQVITKKLDDTVNAKAGFTIPKTLEDKIDVWVWKIILLPTLPAYQGVAGPTPRLIDMIKTHKWGFNPKPEDSKAHWKIVTKKVQDQFTQARYAIKQQIMNSFGAPASAEDPTIVGNLGIGDLCTNLARVNPEAQIVPDAALLARVAFLRSEILKNKERDAWVVIDGELEKIREAFGKNEEKMSKMFKRLLKEDRNTYGECDVTAIQKAAEGQRATLNTTEAAA